MTKAKAKKQQDLAAERVAKKRAARRITRRWLEEASVFYAGDGGDATFAFVTPTELDGEGALVTVTIRVSDLSIERELKELEE